MNNTFLLFISPSLEPIMNFNIYQTGGCLIDTCIFCFAFFLKKDTSCDETQGVNRKRLHIEEQQTKTSF